LREEKTWAVRIQTYHRIKATKCNSNSGTIWILPSDAPTSICHTRIWFNKAFMVRKDRQSRWINDALKHVISTHCHMREQYKNFTVLLLDLTSSSHSITSALKCSAFKCSNKHIPIIKAINIQCGRCSYLTDPTASISLVRDNYNMEDPV
jgi:hypothetical protein